MIDMDDDVFQGCLFLAVMIIATAGLLAGIFLGWLFFG